MKISKTFTIEIEDAKFIFNKPSMKFLLELDGKKGNDYIVKIFTTLIKVEGLSDEDNNMLGADSVLDLPLDLISKIVGKWNEFQFAKNEPEEKKS